MILFVKNMVCGRCIKVVSEELNKLGLTIQNISLGRAEVEEEPGPLQMQKIREVMVENGFELLDEKKSLIVEQVKTLIVNLIHYDNDKPEAEKYSDYISRKLNLDYHYLSSLFSSVENVTIEKYIILQKIEKVKELLVYDELSLSEIAFRLGYSSVQHLSNQFKNVTGFTPSAFKQNAGSRRKPLDKV